MLTFAVGARSNESHKSFDFSTLWRVAGESSSLLLPLGNLAQPGKLVYGLRSLSNNRRDAISVRQGRPAVTANYEIEHQRKEPGVNQVLKPFPARKPIGEPFEPCYGPAGWLASNSKNASMLCMS